MADIKTLQTRIALKYDTYANWTNEDVDGQGANLVLLRGEIGLCEIPSGNANAQTAPTVLFKVGDGTTPFKSLKWASALAADVYGWAKSETVELEGKTIKFVGPAVDAEGKKVVNKTIVLNYATPEEVAAAVKVVSDNLAGVDSRVTALENKFEGEGSVQGQIDALDGRLDIIEGDGDGSVKKALVDAKAYTDEREVEIQKYADQAEADALSEAKKYTDAREVEINKTTAALSAKDAELAGLIKDNADAIDVVEGNLAQELLDRAAGDKAINDKIGTVAEGKTVVKLIEEAEANAASTAQGKVDALANGQVATNTSNIAKNTAAIEALNKDGGTIAIINKAISDEAATREAADTLINEKFGAEYDKDNTVATAIANAQAKAVADAKTETETQVKALADGAVATNASEISRVEGKFDDYVEAQEELGHEARIAAMEAFFEAADHDGEDGGLNDALDTLVEIQNFLSGEGSEVKQMLDAIDANAEAIEAVEKIVSGEDGKSGLVKSVADNASDISDIKSDVADIEATLTGYDKNSTVKAAVDTKLAAADFTQWKTTHEAGHAETAANITKEIGAAIDEVEAIIGGSYSSDSTVHAAIESVNSVAGTASSEATRAHGRLDTVEGDVADLKADTHTHTNKTELDLIVSGDKAKWDEAYSKRHEHSNKAELDLIASGDKAKWDTAATTAATAASDITEIKSNIADLQTLTGGFAEGETNGAIKTAIEAAAALGQQGIDDAAAALKAAQDAQGAADKAQGEVDALEGVVGDAQSGLVKSVADNASEISAIKGDYLKMVDLFIIDCGSSTKNIHTA